MSKVLITGGAGFIGYHLANSLVAQGYQVDLVDNFSRGVQDKHLEELAKHSNVTLNNLNLLNAEATQGLAVDYDHIYHLAAIIGVTHVLQRPFAVLDDNVKLTVNMLEFAKRQKKLQRFLFASTSEIYAGTLQYFTMPIPTPETTPLTVTDLKHPRTSYMLSKIYGEALCYQSGVPVTVFRPHNVYGPRMGMAHVVPELLKRSYETADGGELQVFSVDHKRTFCYVSDAVAMLKLMAETKACEGEALNLGKQGPEVTILEAANTVLEVVGKKLKIVPQPASPGSPARRCPDMSKVKELTGYEARVDIKEGIAKTFSWYRSEIFDAGGITAK
ncbi:MAG: NAD-dependent epimerase/dehydratase family protein [Pseudomonadota bacterium]